jgi:transcriptional regulator with PAS, ATPase and Fis domain
MLLPIPQDFPLFQYTMEQAAYAIPNMEKEQIMNIPSHELREISKQKARELVRKVLENTGENVSKTARILQISRKTVRTF